MLDSRVSECSTHPLVLHDRNLALGRRNEYSCVPPRSIDLCHAVRRNFGTQRTPIARRDRGSAEGLDDTECRLSLRGSHAIGASTRMGEWRTEAGGFIPSSRRVDDA